MLAQRYPFHFTRPSFRRLRQLLEYALTRWWFETFEEETTDEEDPESVARARRATDRNRRGRRCCVSAYVYAFMYVNCSKAGPTNI